MTLNESLLDAIANGTSYFRFVPDNIGKIVYCHTTYPSAEVEPLKQRILIGLVCVVIAAIPIVVVSLLVGLNSIFTMVMVAVITLLFVVVMVKMLNFKGTDFFLGTEGFAVVQFARSRKNIKSKKCVLWKDVENVITKRMQKYDEPARGIVKPNGERVCSKSFYEYRMTFYGYDRDGVRPVLYETDDNTLEFWHEVESAWTKRMLNEVAREWQMGRLIPFDVMVKHKFCDEYIYFAGQKLAVGDMVYDKFVLKSVEIVDSEYKEELVIKDDEGHKVKVDMNDIANKRAFRATLKRFMSE